MCGERLISKLKFQSKMKKTGKPTMEHWTLTAKNLLCRSTVLATGRTQSLSGEHLQNLRPGRRIVLIWDGASYHKAEEMKEFLAAINAGKDAMQWQVRCILFAPNAPEQNPVEDVWLQTKNFIRKYWLLCKSFAVVKWLFKFFTSHQHFDFPKLEQYKKRLSLI